MNRLQTTVLLLVLGASLLEASTLEHFRNGFNELGSSIDEEVRALRAENSDAILAMNQDMLRLLGNYSYEARQAFLHTNLSIQLDEWLNETPGIEECFDVAYGLMRMYTYLTSSRIGICATYAKEEISAESQYHFYSHAHYIMRAGTDGRGRVLESFGLYPAGNEQLEFLQKESEWLEYLWSNYRKVLEQEVEGHAATAERIAEELHTCLEKVLEEVHMLLEYVEYDLRYCIEHVE